MTGNPPGHSMSRSFQTGPVVKRDSYACNSEEKRLDNPMNEQCGAKNRAGLPCRRPPAIGKRRCKLHGGAPGSGAPAGEQNGNYRHGRFTRAASEQRKQRVEESAQRLKEAEARARARIGHT